MHLRTCGWSGRPGAARAIEQIVDVAQDMRGFVDQIEIGGAVEAAEGGVGEGEDVDVADEGVRGHLLEGQLDGLGGAHVAGADGGGEDEDSFGHECTRKAKGGDVSSWRGHCQGADKKHFGRGRVGGISHLGDLGKLRDLYRPLRLAEGIP